jgi:hypothetical protein
VVDNRLGAVNLDLELRRRRRVILRPNSAIVQFGAVAKAAQVGSCRHTPPDLQVDLDRARKFACEWFGRRQVSSMVPSLDAAKKKTG